MRRPGDPSEGDVAALTPLARDAGAPEGSSPMTLEAIRRYLVDEFPQVFAEQDVEVAAAAAGEARLVLSPDRRHLRPGGIVSGPTLMMLADAAAYAALLSATDAAKMAVTTNLTVNFLRGAPGATLIEQDARIIKPGRRLMVLVSEARGGDGAVLAHTTLTYAMPLPEPRLR